VALLALVAIAFAALVGISASGIGRGVLAGLQRGICAVAPGPCPRIVAVRDDLAPCPVEKTERTERLGETIAVVELGSSGTLSAVRHSDGGVTVTLADGSDVGATFKLGGSVALGKEVGGGARAGGGLAWGSGRSWTFPDAAAAADFVTRFGDKATIGGKLVDEVRSRCSLLCDALGWRPHEQLPPPDEVFEQGGATAKLTLGFGLGGRPSEASANAKGLLGRRTARDGTTTWYVALEAAAAAQLGLPASSVELAAGGDALLSYRLDRDGRPLTLGVSLAGRVAGRADVAGAVSGRGRVSSADGNAGELAGGVAELDATLDLADPANHAAAASLLGALTHPSAYPELPRLVRALGARFAEHAQIDVRAYAQRSSATKYGAGVSLGVGLEGSFERATSGLDLVAAFTRLPGLPFLARDDCRAA
jgi:hypothetical protein